jgi:hypothetical protein
MNNVTLFGTCRINVIKKNNNLNNLISYHHSTKEIIQLINFIKNDIKIPKPYSQFCFRTGICKNKTILFTDYYNELFKNSELFVIEISSRKNYIHNNFYLHHLCVDKHFPNHHKNTPTDILNNHIIYNQTDEEIENDIIHIQKILFPKKIIIISHCNSKLNDKYLQKRAALVNLLENISNKYNIPFINAAIVLKKYNQHEIMQKDLMHYTNFGLDKFGNYLNNFILNINYIYI